jgi:hypothetical protein
MTNHGRRYGEKDSHPIPVWNGIFDHYERMGIALWSFAWLIDRIPKNGEQNGVGLVLGGKPIKISEMVETMRGSSYKGVRRQLDTLEEQGYISRRRTPYGFVIEVRNSRKWGIWSPKETGQKGQSASAESGQKGQSLVERLPKKGTEIAPEGQNKENTAVHSSKETQQKAVLPAKSKLWEELGVRPGSLPPALLELFEGLYSTKGSQPIGELLSLGLDMWTDQGNKIPPQLARAAADFRGYEKQKRATACVRPELPELEASPWRQR